MQARSVKRSATVRNAGPLLCLTLEGKKAIMSREGPEGHWQTGLLAASF